MHNDGFVPTGVETIIYFPLHQRRQLVRSSAEALDQLHGPSATEFWKALCCRFKDELFAIGYSYDDARREILTFQEAVHRELLLLYDPPAEGLSAIAT